MGSTTRFMFRSDPNPGLLCGVGGECVFRFKVKPNANGTFKLRFIKRFRGSVPVSTKIVFFDIR